MLTLTIPDSSLWSDSKQEFIKVKGTTFSLEHSLVAISKWESKWHIPYFSKYHTKTEEQALDYVKCMTITQNVNPLVYLCLGDKELLQIKNYIDDTMTATTFTENAPEGSAPKQNNKIITAEEIYYMMIKLQIPIEFQKWHINRLLTLIHVFNVKDAPPKKMNSKDWAKQRKSLNAARHAKVGKHK